jgi:hypothetical protein
VLWRSPSGPSTVRLEAGSSDATLVDIYGHTSKPRLVNGAWEVSLPPARVPQPFDPPGFESTGDPVLLVEENLPAGQPITTPRASFVLVG